MVCESCWLYLLNSFRGTAAKWWLALGNRRKSRDKGSGSISHSVVRQCLGPDCSMKAEFLDELETVFDSERLTYVWCQH